MSRTLGEPTAAKRTLVSAQVARMVLKGNRPPLPPELGAFGEPIKRTDICHHPFQANVAQMMRAIGKRHERGGLEAELRERTPVKEWLAVCLAKTLKKQAGLTEALPRPQ